MVTINQLSRGCRKGKKHKKTVGALEKCPQKRGVCVRVYTMNPKKPNSAIRKVARVRLSTGKVVTVSIPGMGHSLQVHSVVLVRGGRANDLPGVRYRMLRGKLNFDGRERMERKNRRSKYGVPKK